ncbi:hypothetical protein GCM10009122_24240 [Fulvivirga kasyanovii]|uniref:VCBS repeat-containing protein n=1 Tax=Fulvivirga kasyanovii TaxID=396812 RepID=A0ABW9RJ65_9BACT|nr:hypothetical protein [Fulvivirga kasyanovii]MTI23971.1 hypothetical protein [Fulvivirga kasyanovii]
MGLFNIFNKGDKGARTTDNGVVGPTFLDGLTEQIIAPENLLGHEWRRKLKTTSGHTKFRIKYFGQLHPEYQNLIVGTSDAPSLVVAVEPNSGQEILIFDGCIHGYNAMFCDAYSDEQKKNRKADKIYQSLNGIDTFELTISTYHGIDYDDEFASDVDTDGFIELIDGSKVEFETVKRNGFDTLQIFGTTNNGDIIEIVSEELA